MNQYELQEILKRHKIWLNDHDDPNGSKVNLTYANLFNSDLSNADLSYAYLINVNLSNANLRYANLRYANLENADLRYAYLKNANLSNADLTGANLENANLEDIELYGVNLGDNYEYVKSITSIVNDGEDIIGYKQCISFHPDSIGKCIVKLLIPKNAKRSNATGRKCRCEFAKVLEITDMLGNSVPTDSIVYSVFDRETKYIINRMVYPDSFDNIRFNECSNGIHFFLTREEAIDYQLL